MDPQGNEPYFLDEPSQWEEEALRNDPEYQDWLDRINAFAKDEQNADSYSH